jgi:hypothetical protein
MFGSFRSCVVLVRVPGPAVTARQLARPVYSRGQCTRRRSNPPVAVRLRGEPGWHFHSEMDDADLQLPLAAAGLWPCQRPRKRAPTASRRPARPRQEPPAYLSAEECGNGVSPASLPTTFWHRACSLRRVGWFALMAITAIGHAAARCTWWR